MAKKTPARDAEQEFLATYDVSRFDRPSVAVDVALLTVEAGHLHTVLVQRTAHPFKGKWALPGTFLHMDETLEEAAERALSTKAGIRGVFLEQLFTFAAPKRDPRTRVVSIAYYALVDRERLREPLHPPGSVLARLEVPWAGETGGPVEASGPAGTALPLAFDHDQILGMAVKRLRGKLDYSPIGFQLLPERFTLLDLQQVHETILGRTVNKDSFRRRMLASGLLEATGESAREVSYRPPELYRFSKRSAV